MEIPLFQDFMVKLEGEVSFEEKQSIFEKSAVTFDCFYIIISQCGNCTCGCTASDRRTECYFYIGRSGNNIYD